MREIDTGDANLYLLDEHIVLVETKQGVMLDSNKTKFFYEIIEQKMPGDYSLVIHRKHNYRLMRFEVYSIANARARLRSVAIVAPQKTADKMAALEAPLCQKPFAKFSNVEDAIAWSRSLYD